MRTEPFKNTDTASAFTQWMEFKSLDFEQVAALCKRFGWDAHWKSLENIAYGNKRVHWKKCNLLQEISEGLLPAAEVIAFYDLRHPNERARRRRGRSAA